MVEKLSSLIESNREQLANLEELIGYSFNEIGLLLQSLIHRSYAFEHDGRQASDNERLEFLGDAVLDLTIGYALFANYPEMREGDMTRLRAMLVNESHLAEMAGKVSLGRFLFLGKGEDSTDGRRKPSILSCAYEAVVGAIFHDGGYRAVATFVERHFVPCFDEQRAKMHLADAKSRLQELTQERYNEAPSYVLEAEEGPDHQKVFSIAVRFQDKILGHGRATSKKEAEQQAAAEALLKIDDPDILGGI
jgi:ribonuclease-3